MDSPTHPSSDGHPPGTARVLAIGRAGIEMAEDLLRDGGLGLSVAALDSDGTSIRSLDWPDKLFVGARLTRSFGAGGDPDLARAAADEEAPAIRSLLGGHPLIFILAGLGGGGGTGIAPVAARIARESGASVFAFVTLPFACEGTRRQQQALMGLHRLKTVADGVLCLPNEKLLALADDSTPLVETFRASRAHIRDAVRCVWNLLTRPGLMNISFADICAVLRGPNLESAFARVEVSGEQREERALEALLAHPLLRDGEALRHAESLLISFRSGPELAMREVRRITEHLSRQAAGARVVVGAAADAAPGTLEISVVASTRQVIRHDLAAAPGIAPAGDGGAGAATSGPAPAPASASVPVPAGRSARHLAPPAPELTPELADKLLKQVRRGGRRSQGQQVPLPFEIVTKGRFEKCEPTIRRGHNLDQPTYLRRGVQLN